MLPSVSRRRLSQIRFSDLRRAPPTHPTAPARSDVPDPSALELADPEDPGVARANRGMPVRRSAPNTASRAINPAGRGINHARVGLTCRARSPRRRASCADGAAAGSLVRLLDVSYPRALANDVGEIRRVPNSFLQLLERHPSATLILAATNHPKLLDRAALEERRSVL